jgi:hypothetical protein
LRGEFFTILCCRRWDMKTHKERVVL